MIGHNFSQLPLKNTVIPVDDNTNFLAHYDISANDIIGGRRPFGENILDDSILSLNTNKVIWDKVITDGLAVYYHGDKAHYGCMPGNNTSLKTDIWYDISGNKNHLRLKNVELNTSEGWIDGDSNTFSTLKLATDGYGQSLYNKSNLNSDTRTAEAWIKIEGTNINDYHCICITSTLTGASSPTGSEFYFSVRTSDRRLATYWYEKSLPGYHHSINPIPLNEWTHVAVTWDKTEVKLYINGIKDNTIPLSEMPGRQCSEIITIGRQETFRQFVGQIGMFRLYNRALSDEELKMNYLEGKKIYSYVIDTSGSMANALIIGNPMECCGDNGKGLMFDGLSDYLLTSNASTQRDISFNISCSIEAPETSKWLVAHYGTDGVIRRGIFITGNKVNFISTDNALAGVTVTATSAIVYDKWMNIVCTQNGNDLKLYINGVLEGSATMPSNYNTYSGKIEIAKNTRCHISDFNIFKRPIGTQDIYEISNKSIYTLTGIYNDYYLPSEDLIGYWPLTKDYNDYGGLQFTSTDLNANKSFVSVNREQGCLFQGGAFMAGNNTSFNLNKSFTFSLWVNIDNPLTEQYFIDKGNGYYSFGLNASGQLYLRMKMGATTIGTNIQRTGNEVLLKDKWYHLAAAFDGRYIKLYVNGNVDKITRLTSDMVMVYPEDISTVIGSAYSGGLVNQFMGAMKEVRIYNEALTNSDIENLYKNVCDHSIKHSKYGGAVAIEPETMNVCSDSRYKSSSKAIDIEVI